MGRLATAEEQALHEQALLTFVAEASRAQVTALLLHRDRSRQKYRDAWSGFVSHLPWVPNRFMQAIADFGQVTVSGAHCYLMAENRDWDRRMMDAQPFFALDPRQRPGAFLASLGHGERWIWQGEDGAFLISRATA